MKKIGLNKFWFLIVIAYFFSRLINLKIIPIFTDEAIYSYWAQVALHDPVNRFVSMEDGKQPLFIWIAAIIQKLVSDPLVATRLVSVFAGLGSTIGIFLLAKTLLGEKVAKIATVLYIILPFTLLYDRMALFDSLLTMFGIYSLFFAVKIAKGPKLDLALINGVVLGLGLITKSSANFYLYLLPASLLFFDFHKSDRVMRLSKWFSLTLLSVLISQIIFNSLRVSPLFYLIGRKNLEFIRSPQEVLNNPFMHFSGNLNSIVIWFLEYNGPIFILLVLVTMLWGIYRFKKPILILTFYILAPLVAELFFNKVLYPRFSLFYFPYVIILASHGIERILRAKTYSKLTPVIILIILAYPVISSFLLLTNPPKSKITKADKNQYLNDWPAGYGVKEVVKILDEESKKGKVYVGTEGTFGLLPFALQIYFYGRDDVHTVGFWPVREIPPQVLEAAKSTRTFFVFNENQSLPSTLTNTHLKLVGKYQKGSGNSYMRIYEIIP